MVAQPFEKTGGTRGGQAGDPGAKVTGPEAADAPLAQGQSEGHCQTNLAGPTEPAIKAYQTAS